MHHWIQQMGTMHCVVVELAEDFDPAALDAGLRAVHHRTRADGWGSETHKWKAELLVAASVRPASVAGCRISVPTADALQMCSFRETASGW
jgi:hypothetical protein